MATNNHLSMHLRTFKADSMAEALRMIRRELGSDAAVVRSRSVRLSGWIGLLSGRRGVEVTASPGAFDGHPLRQVRAAMDQGIDLSGEAALNFLPACPEAAS